MRFESIVRPFQLDNISPPPPQTASSGAASDTVTLKYGVSGKPKILMGSLQVTVTFYMVKEMREKTT